MQEVPLPHWPLVVISRPPGAVPVGMEGPPEDVLEVGGTTTDVEVEVDVEVGLVEVVEVDELVVEVVVGVVEVLDVLEAVEVVDVVVTTGTGRGHPHTPY